MAHPRCPRCRKVLTYPHSADFLNPWSCKCPHCAAALEMSPAWKCAYVGGIAAGVAAAWFAQAYIVQLAFWGIVVLLPLHRATWQFMRLRLKQDELGDAAKTA